jgi:toxin YoeB
MKYKIEYAKEADKVIAKYKNSNPQSFKKLLKLQTELVERDNFYLFLSSFFSA